MGIKQSAMPSALHKIVDTMCLREHNYYSKGETNGSDKGKVWKLRARILHGGLRN
jgi:hypothetical protein